MVKCIQIDFKNLDPSIEFNREDKVLNKWLAN